jgi:hypothetical protein
VGPLATLGLAGVQKGRVVLSKRGWDLALADSPILDAAGAETLGPEERTLFLESLHASKSEKRALTEFLSAVRQSNMTIAGIDEQLTAQHPDATSQHITAIRAAQIGRLTDCGILRVAGRGPSATMELTQSGFDLCQ